MDSREYIRMTSRGKLWTGSRTLNSSPPPWIWALQHKYSCFCCSAALFSLAYQSGTVNSHSAAVEEEKKGYFWKQEAARLYRCNDKPLRGDERNHGSCVPESRPRRLLKLSGAACPPHFDSRNLLAFSSKKITASLILPFSALSFWFHIPIFIYHLPVFFLFFWGVFNVWLIHRIWNNLPRSVQENRDGESAISAIRIIAWCFLSGLQ